MSTKVKFEAGVALASVGIGLAGAVLVEPIILGIAAVGAAVATAMRLTDSGLDRPSRSVSH